MKTKIMAGVAIAAIAATGVVGGFAIANGGLNSGIAAAASDHSLTIEAADFAAYSASDSTTTYYGWDFRSSYVLTNGSYMSHEYTQLSSIFW
jgi:hypothetical protein